MENPKEKAKELVLKFAFKGAQHESEAKKFALIAVNEMIELLYSLKLGNALSEEIEFYEEVKSELNKPE